MNDLKLFEVFDHLNTTIENLEGIPLSELPFEIHDALLHNLKRLHTSRTQLLVLISGVSERPCPDQ